MNIQNKTVLITGANRGIGRAPSSTIYRWRRSLPYR
jgi:short-subunit dehydrogenase involved in D-alanine esterification of teichoic acids